MNGEPAGRNAETTRPSGGRVDIRAPLPPGAKPEIIGSICATVLGAAEAASSELKLGAPRTIEVSSDDGNITIQVEGRGAAVMLGPPRRKGKKR